MPKSALDMLGNSLKRKSSRKGGGFAGLAKAFKRRGRKGKGIAAMANYKIGRGRRKGGLAGAMTLGDRVYGKAKRRKGRNWERFARDAARAMSDRPTKAEREETAVQVERAIDNDSSLRGAMIEAALTDGTSKQTFIQRLVSAVRKRISRQVN
jgi:hypothetical protein